MTRGDSDETLGLTPGLFELHSTLDALSTYIYVKDRALRIVSANRAFCDALGITREELLGQTTNQFLGAAGAESARRDREVIESGTPRLGIIESYPGPDGLRWVVTDKAPIHNSDGSVVGLVGTSIDITEHVNAQARLQESEVQLRFLTEHMADILWTMDLQFHTTFVTPSIKRVLGFTPEERRLQSLQEMVTPESGECILAELQRQLQFEVSGSAERDRTLIIDVEYYRKNGSTVWMETLIQAVRDDAGNLVGMAGVSRDITERRSGAEALRESERLLRESEQLSNLGGWSYDVATEQMRWTRGVFAIHEMDPDVGIDFIPASLSCYPPGSREKVDAAFRKAVEQGEPYDLEVPFVTVKGNHRWVRTVGHAELHEGIVARVTGNIIDITQQHEAAESLRTSEEKYHALFELSKDAAYLVSLDGHFLEVNQAWIDLFGYTRDEASRLRVEAIYEDPSVRAAVFLPHIEQGGEVIDWEIRFRKRNGTVMDCLCNVVARRDASGAIICLQGMVRDITEQKRSQRALKESEEKYRQLFEQSVDAINLVGVDGKIIEANPAWFSLFGYAPDDVGSYDAADVYVEPEGRARFLRAIAEQDTVEDEVQFKRKDGTVFDCHRVVTVRRAADLSIVGYQTVFHDVTETRKAERALRENEEKYRQIFDQSIAPISLLAPDGHLIDANDAWFRLFGYSREDALSINAANLNPTPELREESVRRLLSSGTLIDDEARVKTRDGTIIDVLRSMVVRHNPDGSVLGYQSVWRDVTELRRVQDELLASREQLRQLALRIQDAREDERTAIARELHDHFGQELTALRLDLQSLTSSPPPAGDAGLVRIRGILQLVDRMSQEVRRVISEMRPGMLDDLGLCAALEWQAGQFSERTGIACNLILTADDTRLPPSVNTALFRTFQELLTNVARYAGADYVDVSLISDSDCVYLAVVDDGRGITDEELHDSTSLGILGIQERIRACGGNVTFQGEPGKGTTVTVTVPLQTCADDG